MASRKSLEVLLKEYAQTNKETESFWDDWEILVIPLDSPLLWKQVDKLDEKSVKIFNQIQERISRLSDGELGIYMV